MGSSQSTIVVSNGESSSSIVGSPPNSDTQSEDSNCNSNSNTDSQNIRIDEENKKKKKKSHPSHLSGFPLVQYNCRKKKKAYDTCQSLKHSAFVSGKLLRDSSSGDAGEISCEELFEIYKECIYKGMHEDRKKRGLPEPKEDSALGTFVDYFSED